MFFFASIHEKHRYQTNILEMAKSKSLGILSVTLALHRKVISFQKYHDEFVIYFFLRIRDAGKRH